MFTVNNFENITTRLSHFLRLQVLVAKSPVAPFTTFNYTIQKDGIIQEGMHEFIFIISFVISQINAQNVPVRVRIIFYGFS